MPADRLTLYYSGRDPNANRRRAAKTVSIGCESKFNHRLFGGGHLLRLQLREGGRSSYRPQDGLARRALLTKVATSRAAASQPRQDLPIVHDFVISRPSGKPALARLFVLTSKVQEDRLLDGIPGLSNWESRRAGWIQGEKIGMEGPGAIHYGNNG